MRVGGARQADARVRRHVRRELGVPRQGLVDRQRIRVEVEQPPRPGHERREIGEAVEPRLEPQPPAVVREAEPRGTVRQAQGARERRAVALLDARERSDAHPREQPGGVERLSVGQRELDARRRGRRRRGGTPARAQLGRRQPEHLPHRVVELPHAREPRRERHVGDRQVRADEQQPRGVGAVRAGQGQRAGAELGREQPRQVTRRVAEPRGEPRDSLALDHAVGDQPHGAAGGIPAHVPVRRSGRGLRQAPLACPVARLVGRGARGEERDVRLLRRARGARRAAVDAGGAHRGDELPVEPRVARRDRRVPLREGHVRAHASSLTRPMRAGWRFSDIAVAAGETRTKGPAARAAGPFVDRGDRERVSGRSDAPP